MKKKQKGLLSFSAAKEVLEKDAESKKNEQLDTSEKREIRQKLIQKRRQSQKKFPSVNRPGVRVEIEGFNQTRLLNELARNGITLLEIDKISSKKIKLFVSNKDSKKAFAILDNLEYTYRVVKKFSLASVRDFFLRRLALSIGLIVIMVLGVYGYGFIWRVEISGTSTIEPALIERYIAENGFGRLSRKSNFDAFSLQELINSLDSVLESTVEIVGTTLRVDIVECTIYQVAPPVNMVGIFSNFDATVTRIEALSGTPLVDIGTRVFAGKNLIAAHRISSLDEVIPVPANGRVYGMVTFSASTRFNLTENLRLPTGNYKRFTRLSIFGSRFREVKNPFESGADFYVEYSYPFNNFFIPVRMQQTKVIEMTWQETTHNLDEKIDSINNRVLVDNIPHIGASDYTKSYHLEKINDNEFLLHTFITAELLVGET